MKIVYLHQYFLAPEQGGAIRSYYLARTLVEKGFTVEMITAHNSKEYLFKEVDGIRVHYLPVYYDNKLGFFGRVFSFLKFVRMAYKKAKEIKDAELCYATSTPLTIGYIALRLKKKTGLNYYFEVRDLWPEAPIQMGAIKNPLLIWWLRRLEKKIYEGADKIIALSPGMRDGVEKVCPGKPVYIIPNISDCNFFQPSIKNPSEVEKYKVGGKFVVTYFGAIGKVNHLEFLLNAVKLCKEKGMDQLRFLVVGKGGALPHIQSLAEKMGLNNLQFFDYRNKEGVREILSVTDAVYISFDDKPVLETNSPNKFFDGIASGKLIIVNSKGWIKNLIEEHSAGFYTNPHKPEEFVNSIQEYINDKSKLIASQKNARQLAEMYFSKEILTEKFLQVFSKESRFGDSTSSVYILTA